MNLQKHLEIINHSYFHWTKRKIFNSDENIIEQASRADFALVSHGTESDPVFNYGNDLALKLFEYTFEEFIKLPSRMSADQQSQEERNRLMTHVTQFGFYDGYRGVRISKTNKKFEILDASIWNLIQNDGSHYGQAALIRQWKNL